MAYHFERTNYPYLTVVFFFALTWFLQLKEYLAS